MPGRRSRIILLAIALAVLVIVPFVLFGDRIEAWTHSLLLDRRPHGLLPRLLCVLLLVSDILLPVPSSVVSTAAGLWWGLWQGSLISLIGMQLGSWLGYALGSRATALRRWVGDEEVASLNRWFARHGEWIIVMLRPVPVLAEASTLFAGFSRMDWVRYNVLSLAANACISLFYGVLGSFFRNRAPGAAALFLLVLLAAIAAWWTIAKRFRR